MGENALDSLTRQALPSYDYLVLLGASICAFNSNNAFIVENILNTSPGVASWHELIDLESGRLKPIIADTIIKKTDNPKITDLFEDIVSMRNRIIHSFQITTENGDQLLATKVRRTHEQFRITGDYLRDFLRKNELLSDLLHEYRGY